MFRNAENGTIRTTFLVLFLILFSAFSSPKSDSDTARVFKTEIASSFTFKATRSSFQGRNNNVASPNSGSPVALHGDSTAENNSGGKNRSASTEKVISTAGNKWGTIPLTVFEILLLIGTGFTAGLGVGILVGVVRWILRQNERYKFRMHEPTARKDQSPDDSEIQETSESSSSNAAARESPPQLMLKRFSSPAVPVSATSHSSPRLSVSHRL